jgi:acyl carrier protein
MNSLSSREQITAIKDHFAAVEITDADFNRIEVIGDLIRHIEIVDTRATTCPFKWNDTVSL